MNKFKLAKAIIFYLLFAIVVFSIVFSVLFYVHEHSIAVIVIMLNLFVVGAPTYYLLIHIVKTENRIKHNIKDISTEISHISDESGEKIRQFEGFESIAKSIEDLNELSKRNQNINNILNDILVCTAKNLEFNKFVDNVIDKIMEVVSSDWAVFYLFNKGTNKLEIKSSRGFSKSIYSQYDITIGEGFIGNAAAKNEIKVINDLPDDIVFIANTFLGKIKPKSLVVVPISNESNEILGVLAAASLYEFSNEHMEILNKIKKYISYAIANGNYYNKTLRAANELKFQNQLIQNLNEDLEDRIKERTLFLNGIINSIKDTAIISVDSNNIITTFNKTAEDMLSFSADEIKGKNIKVIAKNEPEFEKLLLNDIFEASTNKFSHDIFNLVNKDGKKYSVNIQMFVINNEIGGFEGVTIVIKDVSDINKITNNSFANERLASVLFKNSISALVLANEKGEISDINKNALYVLETTYDMTVSRRIHVFFEQAQKISDFIGKVSDSGDSDEIEAKVLKSHLNVLILVHPIKNDFTGEIRLLIEIH